MDIHEGADAEGIRDWNLRAVYGAFNAMKNGDGAADHRTAQQGPARTVLLCPIMGVLRSRLRRSENHA